LLQISYVPVRATNLHEDDKATMAIVNLGKPTPHTPHIAIQMFVVQDWQMDGFLILVKTHTNANAANTMTKCLDFVKV